MNMDIAYTHPTVHWATVVLMLALPVLLGSFVWRRSERTQAPFLLAASLIGMLAESFRARDIPASPWPTSLAELGLVGAIIVLPAAIVAWTGRRYLATVPIPRLSAFIAWGLAGWLLVVVAIVLAADPLLGSIANIR